MAERLPEAKAKSDIKKTGHMIVIYHSDSKCDSDYNDKSDIEKTGQVIVSVIVIMIVKVKKKTGHLIIVIM